MPLLLALNICNNKFPLLTLNMCLLAGLEYTYLSSTMKTLEQRDFMASIQHARINLGKVEKWYHCNEIRSSHRRCSIEKGVSENFAKFAGKHLCQSIFFNKVAGLGTIKVQASGLQLC